MKEDICNQKSEKKEFEKVVSTVKVTMQLYHHKLHLLASDQFDGAVFDCAKRSKHIRFCNLIDSVLHKLSPTDEFILRNMFNPLNEQEWYLNYFSTSTYYRLRRVALQSFHNLIKNDHVVLDSK